jgi:hypothetical protein
MKDNSLVQFVRDRKGQPRGIVVATVINDEIRLGWSYTNIKAGDRFDKSRGLRIALGSAESGQSHSVTTPHSVHKVMTQITTRAERYYKNISLNNNISASFCEDLRGE